jgi:hypothetical protein
MELKNYYTIYNKEKEPIAIFEDINHALLFRSKNRKNVEKSIQFSYKSDNLLLYKVEQPKGKLIGYFSKLEFASEILFGGFECERIWNN